VFITVVLLAAGSLLSQFSSTLLVSDLKPFELRAWQDSVREINYTFSDSLFQSIIQEPGSMLSSRLNEDPVFAEHATDRVVINNKTAGGLKDSGNVTRAFFPMPKAERMNIASYRGPARALFTNSICFSPRFVEATAVLTDENGNASENANTTRLVMFSGQLANITGDDLLARSSWRYGGEEISFPKIENCTLGINGMGICVVEDSERLNTLLNASKIASADLYTWILVAIPTRPVADGANLSDTQRLDRKPQRLVNQSYDGTEWLSQHYESIPVLGQQPGLGLRVKHSLCGIYADWGTSDISVDRRYNFIEPEPQRKPLQWQDSERDNITLRFFKIGYDPSSIQKQFGVDGLIKKPARDRGILSLSSSNRRTLQDRWFVRQTIYRRFEKPTGTRLSIGGLGASSPNQQLEWDHENSFFDPWVETIFINAFRDTGTLSLAWESAVTYVFGSHYASYLSISDVAGNVTVSFFETHEIPRQFRGIGVVLGVITLHLGLLMAVLGVFLRSESFKVGLEDPMRYLGVQSQRGEKTD